MRGTKARALRQLAGHKPTDITKYEAINHTIRTKEFTVPVTQEDGTVKIVVKAAVKTATLTLQTGTKKLYRMLKTNPYAIGLS